VPADPRGRIEAPIGRDPRQRTRFAVVHGGRPSVTRYRVLESAPVALEDAGRAEVASLVCELETGRTHQIRVHLAAVGAPVAGDPLYVPRPRIARALGLTRPALHAAGLTLSHPVTGETLAFEEPLPNDLESAYARAGLAVPAAGVRA
jgi:23S rRNA pseudouridine1911/1915/1917 synthase